MLPSQLIGEALHVYACRWLPDITKTGSPETSASQAEESVEKNRRILEIIVSMIPADRGSVSVGFLLRLLSIAIYLGVSPVTKTELRRRASLQFEEATVSDLLLPSHLSSNQHSYDIDLVMSLLESYLVLWRRQSPAPAENGHFLRSIRKVAKLIDSYLQVVARDVNMPVMKVVSLAEAFPDFAREEHDDLYKFVNMYLKVRVKIIPYATLNILYLLITFLYIHSIDKQEHPDLSKAEKKRLCRILDCQKLSPEVRAHAVKNDRLPLRTVVQLLFFEQETGSRTTGQKMTTHELVAKGKQIPVTEHDISKLQLGSRRSTIPESSEGVHQKLKRSDGKVLVESERSKVVRENTDQEVESQKGKETRGDRNSGSKLDIPKKSVRQRSKPEHGTDR